MSNSRNWKATAIPSLDGKKIELKVLGTIKTGIVNPHLGERTTGNEMPSNVKSLTLAGLGSGPEVEVSYSGDITGKKNLQIVLVYLDTEILEAAIIIDYVES